MIAPKTTTSTTSATMMPIDSPLRASSSAIVVKSAFSVACPANWVVNPSAVVEASTSRTPSTVGGVVLRDRDRDQRVVLVLGDESGRRLGRRLERVVVRRRRAGHEVGLRRKRALELLDVRLERRVIDRERLGVHDHELRARALLRGGELLVDHFLRLDRLRTVRERDVVVEDVAEQRGRQAHHHDEQDAPDPDDPPGVPAARSGQRFRIDPHRATFLVRGSPQVLVDVRCMLTPYVLHVYGVSRQPLSQGILR